MKKRGPSPKEWDVVVVGYGYAGAAAACAAHDAGASVLLVEKMATPGGISICSSGGIRYAEESTAAFSYLAATNGGTTDEALLRTLAESMTELPSVLRGYAERAGATLKTRRAPANYPFPGHDAFGFITVEEAPGFDAERTYPHVRGAVDGARLFHIMEENVRQRNLPCVFGARAERIRHTDSDNDAGVGLTIHGERGAETLRVRGGLILACGGFEANSEMQREFWPERPVMPASFLGNTGDGIRIAQSEGGALWHMWHYHGSYGFRHPDPAYPYGIRTKRLPDWMPGVHASAPDGMPRVPRMPWIVVNRSGRRFMNEYDPYLQDTGHRPLARFRPDTQRFDAIPAFLIADDMGRRQYAFGRETYNDPKMDFRWSADNSEEIELGLLRQAPSLAAVSDALSMDAQTLSATIDVWNQACETGRDELFDRPPSSMMPIRDPPFVFAELWPVVSNTQGGLVHDSQQRVLNGFGEPIDGVYVAGELGSVFGHLYLSGGNLAECFVGGRIAGIEAARRSGAAT